MLKDWCDDSAVFTLVRIQLKHVHGHADVDQDNEDNQPNVSNVGDCFSNERHVERSVVEESEPVEHGFDTLANNDKGTNISLLNLTRQMQFEDIHTDDPQCAEILEQVDPIVWRRHVLAWALEELSDLNLQLIECQ